MRLYSNTITASDVYRAFGDARNIDGCDIYADDVRDFRPRAYGHGVQFYATSRHGTRATAHRVIGSYPLNNVGRAASWTDYGYVIARLFRIDPHAKIGPYMDRADFIRQVESHYRQVESRYRKESADFLDLVRCACRGGRVQGCSMHDPVLGGCPLYAHRHCLEAGHSDPGCNEDPPSHDHCGITGHTDPGEGA